jgi:hypothetical protein
MGYGLHSWTVITEKDHLSHGRHSSMNHLQEQIAIRPLHEMLRVILQKWDLASVNFGSTSSAKLLEQNCIHQHPTVPLCVPFHFVKTHP